MELLADTIGELTESPFWHPAEQALYWCDIDGRQIGRRRILPEGAQVERWAMPAEPGCIAPMRDGGLVVAMRGGLFHFSPDAAVPLSGPLLAAPYDPDRYRFNDGRCDPAGRFLAGTLNESKTAADAQLYQMTRHSGGWQCQSLASGVMTANGLAFSPNGQLMYWADTRGHRVDVFDYVPSSGAVSNRREFVRFEPKAPDGSLVGYGGRPDGAAVDAEGCYWVAMYEGAQILRISPTGQTLCALEVPVQCPTMVCFGGPDLRTLYVTSARAGRPADELVAKPDSGGIFEHAVSVPGLPVSYCS